MSLSSIYKICKLCRNIEQHHMTQDTECLKCIAKKQRGKGKQFIKKKDRAV